MSKSLNYNNVKKRYLSVTLADGKNTTLLVYTDAEIASKEAALEYIKGLGLDTII